MGPRKRKRLRTADDDAVMALVVQELRANPDARPTPEYWRAMLARLLELLNRRARDGQPIDRGVATLALSSKF